MADKVLKFSEITQSSTSSDKPSGNGRVVMFPANPNDLFVEGNSLEENPTTQEEAIACYKRCLELDPQHVGAHINLGTIYYNRFEYRKAEDEYRAAITVDSQYAKAHFNL